MRARRAALARQRRRSSTFALRGNGRWRRSVREDSCTNPRSCGVVRAIEELHRVLLKTQELFLIEERSQHSLRAFAMRREPCRAGTGSILIPRVGTAEALLLLRVAAQRGAEDKVEDDTNENVQMLRAWNVRRGALPVEESRSDPRGAKIDFCVRTAHSARETFQGRSERKEEEGREGRDMIRTPVLIHATIRLAPLVPRSRAHESARDAVADTKKRLTTTHHMRVHAKENSPSPRTPVAEVLSLSELEQRSRRLRF